MNDLPRFIKLDNIRINLDEIVSYGMAIDEDDDNYLYIETKTSEDVFEFYADDVDFDLEEMLDELDNLLLIGRLGPVDFQRE